MTKNLTLLLFIGLALGQAESDTSQIDYYELGAIAAKQDFNSLSYLGLGLVSIGNPLLAYAAVLIVPINIDEEHKSIIETKNGKSFIRLSYSCKKTDLVKALKLIKSWI